ncbi:DUF1207 domain-containing protein [Aeoliella sp.]|uniref:DUF1207 domain-containing protein n=1 Tax=Aeoliella sp. TaxID=2795800 RepID=UPI003CCC0820
MRHSYAPCASSLVLTLLVVGTVARGGDNVAVELASGGLVENRAQELWAPYAADSVPQFDPAVSSAQYTDTDLTLAGHGSSSCAWQWQLLPEGLIYRSYLAGPREPRFQLNYFEETSSNQTLWDVTLGGRRGLLRFGTEDPLRPQGWQLDIEGAGFVRLNIDNHHDVDVSDYRFGIPLTYGHGRWQFKIGYYHVSSHLGDELIVRMPSAQRKNYVRDSMLIGVSFNPRPAWRLYGETAYAFKPTGGAKHLEFQTGVEYAQPGPTGFRGTPFFATNGHLRQENNFGGDYTLQLGWLWRGRTGSTMRTGFQFLTGKSNQYQFFNESEEQYGWGLWYDF